MPTYVLRTRKPVPHPLTRVASEGWPVFPCGLDKKPLTPNGFKDASHDPATIATWIERWPDCLVGVPTGEVSGLFVLDVDLDPDKGIDGFASLRDLGLTPPETRTHRTRRGGAHYLFRHCDGLRNTASKIAPGVDTRGDGGYVIWWPTIGLDVEHADVLAEVPEWIVGALERPKVATTSAPAPMHQASDRYAERALQNATGAVMVAPAGARNDTLNREALGLFGLAKAGRLDEVTVRDALTRAAQSAGLDDGEIAKTLDSAYRAATPRQEKERQQVEAPLRARSADTSNVGDGLPEDTDSGYWDSLLNDGAPGNADPGNHEAGNDVEGPSNTDPASVEKPNVPEALVSLRDALEVIPSPAVLGKHPAPQLIGMALRHHESGVDEGDGRALCTWWDSITGADSLSVFERADPDYSATKPTTTASVLKLARELGWTPPAAKKPTPIRPPSFDAMAITEDELDSARLTPKCIVRNYLYANVAVLAAPGGVGKSTLMLREAIDIILGRPVWGNAVENPGWVLIVTAEDSRETFVAKLREIMAEMDLQCAERDNVLAALKIWDVTGEPVKLATMRDGNVVITELADDIVREYQDNPPVLVVFDPLVSFGASEQAVNDNEQSLVLASRRIVKDLECCVRLIAHTGKANGREKTLDQYSSRGGSALADGSRMMAVLATWAEGDQLQPPHGCTAGADESIFVMARPKLSYVKPQSNIWFRRRGYHFEHFVEVPVSRQERSAVKAEQLHTFLTHELKQGRSYTSRDLDDIHETLNMSRKDMRAALATLRAGGGISDQQLPAEQRHGAKKTYLHPSYCAAPHGAIDPKTDPKCADADPIAPPPSIAPPYRDLNGGAIAAPFIPSDPSIAPDSNGAIRRNGAIRVNPSDEVTV